LSTVAGPGARRRSRPVVVLSALALAAVVLIAAGAADLLYRMATAVPVRIVNTTSEPVIVNDCGDSPEMLGPGDSVTVDVVRGTASPCTVDTQSAYLGCLRLSSRQPASEAVDLKASLNRSESQADCLR